MNLKRLLSFTVVYGTFCLPAMAQNPIKQSWHLLDKNSDGFYGISIEKAYEFLKGKKSETVIIGVIDGGTDTTHEDLKPVLWHNKKEIAGNGKDDDGNGYPDDVLGWNFLGNRRGENVGKENLEAARLYHAYKQDFAGITVEPTVLTEERKSKYDIWIKAEKKLTVSQEDKFNFRLIKSTADALAKQDSILMTALGKDSYTIHELENATLADNTSKRAKFSFLRTVQLLEFDGEKSNTEIFEELNEYLDQQQSLMDAKEKPLVNYRAIIGDNYCFTFLAF